MEDALALIGEEGRDKLR